MNYNEIFTQISCDLAQSIRARKTDVNVRFTYNDVVYDVADRPARVQLIDRISYDYMTQHAAYVQAGIDRWCEKGANGERPVTPTPDTGLLERLADAILDEELTDRNEYKVTHAEYPFLSERQFERRYEREYSLTLADAYDLDGVNRAKPIRRHRTAKEERFIDKASRIKNRQRNAQYKRDTSPGTVVPYNLRDTGGELAPEFIQCREITYNCIPEYYR